MTGYGRAECACSGTVAIVEIKTLNHRFADVVLRFPRELFALEDQVRQLVGEVCQRGRVEVYASLQPNSANQKSQYTINQPLLKATVALLRQVMADGSLDVALPSAGHLLAVDGLLIEHVVERLDEGVEVAVLNATRAALQELAHMRRTEGESLFLHLRKRAQDLREVCSELSVRAPEALRTGREKLARRLAEVLAVHAVESQRLALETAIAAERTSVEEELERLQSHVRQFMRILDEQGQAGKRLEFLLQEMAREVNTIGAKSADLKMTEGVLAAKHILEQMREQTQNVE